MAADAAVFEAVSNSLASNSRHERRIALISHRHRRLPIQRVLWAVWDHVSGPYVQFRWDVESETRRDKLLQSPTTQVVVHAEVHRSRADSVDSGTDDQQPGTSKGSAAGGDLKLVIPKLNGLTNANGIVAASPLTPTSFLCDEDRLAAMHALGSEISRTHLTYPIDGVEFKLSCVSARSLLMLSYVFSAAHAHGAEAVQCFTFLLPSTHLQWCIDLQSLLRPAITDVVLRLKALLRTGAGELRACDASPAFMDIVCRITSDVECLLSLLAHQSLYSTASLQREHTYADSHFASADTAHDACLREAISATLQCNGHALVVGDTVHEVNKMILTLSLCLPNSYQQLCFLLPENPSQHTPSFCAYLKLQGALTTLPGAAKPWDDPRVMLCEWPIAVICVAGKKETAVRISTAPYPAHQKLRIQALHYDLQRLAADLEQEPSNSAPPKPVYEPYNRTDTFIQLLLLTHLDCLPLDSAVRCEYLLLFQGCLDEHAKALIVFVECTLQKHPAMPRAEVYVQARRALDLNSDGDFYIVLSRAEYIKPGSAAFITCSDIASIL